MNLCIRFLTIEHGSVLEAMQACRRQVMGWVRKWIDDETDTGTQNFIRIK